MAQTSRILQYQKPMAAVLAACVLPAVAGVYNFGWRVVAVVVVCCLCCFGAEYAFLRRQRKPVTMAALVTGVLLALTLPPNLPFWMAGLGSVFAIVFGKMAFGGFGRNVFNPAMVGRCFLYVSFPLFMAGTWCGPIGGPAGGLLRWAADQEREPVHEVDQAPGIRVDGVARATLLAAVKKLDMKAVAAKRESAPEAARIAEGVRSSIGSVSTVKLLIGRTAGSQGETCALAILLGFAYLLYRKAVFWQLTAAPILGLAIGWAFLRVAGLTVLPLTQTALVNLLGGGTLFAVVFMTTEPVSAPRDKTARWIYGILIGFLGATIRALSAFNAGLMFAILLGNTFGPIIEVGCQYRDARRKARGAAA